MQLFYIQNRKIYLSKKILYQYFIVLIHFIARFELIFFYLNLENFKTVSFSKFSMVADKRNNGPNWKIGLERKGLLSTCPNQFWWRKAERVNL